jgi:hypothetical protein
MPPKYQGLRPPTYGRGAQFHPISHTPSKRLSGKKWKLAVQPYRDRKYPIDEIYQLMEISKPTLVIMP